MKKSYVKGLANHNDPESCGGARKSDGRENYKLRRTNNMIDVLPE